MSGGSRFGKRLGEAIQGRKKTRSPPLGQKQEKVIVKKGFLKYFLMLLNPPFYAPQTQPPPPLPINDLYVK